jgi:hypothetical protein
MGLNIEERTHIGDGWKQGAEENVWTQKVGIK